MPSIVKRGDSYRAYIRIKVAGERINDSATFRTKREASAWAAARESDLRTNAKLAPAVKFTLANLLLKYADEVSPTKRGSRWEIIRLKKLAVDEDLPVDKPVAECTSESLGIWRDARLLAEIKPNTVIREFGLLSAVFEYARRELKWIEVNPVRDVRKPKAAAHREVVITRWQIKVMLNQLGYSRRVKIESANQRVAVCFLVALRTGMRASELCYLTWHHVHENYCVLPVTKTVPRNVPLSKKAVRLIKQMEGFDQDKVFGLKPAVLDTLFRRARQAADLDGFTFHDARHTAATWMSNKVDVLTLCKIFGWKDTKQALTYYNPKAGDLAGLLD
jgi:integrase